MRRRTMLQAGLVAAAVPTRFAFAQPDRRRVLRFVPQASLTILDPIFTSSSITADHAWAIYDTLFAVTTSQDFKPQMAEGYTVSDDGRTCLIRLRDGLKFHNGEPVRAQDCAASLKRWAAREVVGQTAAEFVDSWGVQDDRTIRIAMKQKLPIFMDLIGVGGATLPFIMPEHIAATDPFKAITETIGSGPLKFVKDEYVQGARVVYEKNRDYVPRQEPADWHAGGKIVYFDRVEWQIIPDAATAAAALQSGEVDWYEQVQADLVPLLRRAPGIAIGSANPTGYMGLLRFNHLLPPFDNPAVRRALLLAVDQTDYMTAITGNDSAAIRVCKAMFPCSTPYGRELGAADMPGDLARGRASLRDAGYNNEKVVVVNPVDYPTIAPMGEVTFDLVKKLGMNAEIVETDYGTMSRRLLSKEPVDKGGWSISHTWARANVIQNPVQNQFMRGLGAAGLPGWYADDKQEQLTRAWLLAGTQAERDALADAVQRRAFEMVPMIPLGLFQIRTARNKNLVGQIEANGALFWNIRWA